MGKKCNHEDPCYMLPSNKAATQMQAWRCLSQRAGTTGLWNRASPLRLPLLLCLLGCATFIMIARKKRATRGAYSPSRQENTGARLQMGPMMKPPPEERLIWPWWRLGMFLLCSLFVCVFSIRCYFPFPSLCQLFSALHWTNWDKGVFWYRLRFLHNLSTKVPVLNLRKY